MTTTYATYMKVTLNSEGATPTEVTTTMKKLGWVPVYGPYDYKYNWNNTWTSDYTNVEKVMPNFDTVHKALKGYNIGYHYTTYESGKEDFWTGI